MPNDHGVMSVCAGVDDVPTGLMDASGRPLTEGRVCGHPVFLSVSCGVCGWSTGHCAIHGGMIATFRAMAEHQTQHREERQQVERVLSLPGESR